ncbi:DUF4846 domain-containing protein [Foetidibacter luteolus]|uniref:DUF4846 domain-containing protein n=1 Tax=Foetidibacter luteolus TaxID=2608880 RepID=UPI00129A38AF|nr:DUF4846 domain-containing protein [Foetidibacter luteolus]
MTGMEKITTGISLQPNAYMKIITLFSLYAVALLLSQSAAATFSKHKTLSAHCREMKLKPAPVNNISTIWLPAGYQRPVSLAGSFAAWLGMLMLKADNRVFLYNKQLKQDQASHYAVIDISTGDEDLQQCADAIMRLRSEYFWTAKNYAQVKFPASGNVILSFDRYAKGERYDVHNNKLYVCRRANTSPNYTHSNLMNFLRIVFTYCGTYTVRQQTNPVADLKDIQAGDVLVKAGSPGHAMIVADVAVNKETGRKIFLLAQGYMPAQDMHIVKNKNNAALSPWYSVEDIKDKIVTPGYVFDKTDLRRWK